MWAFKFHKYEYFCQRFSMIIFLTSNKICSTKTTKIRGAWLVDWPPPDLVVFLSGWITSSWFQQQTDSRWLRNVLGKLSSVWRPGLQLQTWTNFKVLWVVSTSSLPLSVFQLLTIGLWSEAWAGDSWGVMFLDCRYESPEFTVKKVLQNKQIS